MKVGCQECRVQGAKSSVPKGKARIRVRSYVYADCGSILCTPRFVCMPKTRVDCYGEFIRRFSMDRHCVSRLLFQHFIIGDVFSLLFKRDPTLYSSSNMYAVLRNNAEIWMPHSKDEKICKYIHTKWKMGRVFAIETDLYQEPRLPLKNKQ